MNQTSTLEQLRGLIQLTRWKEYIGFVIPVTVLGALFGLSRGQIPVDWRLLAVIIANILVVAYAFMINDIEDAPDDARDPARAAKNPISSGRIGVRFGYAACRVVAAVTVVFYAFGGLGVLITGLLTLLLCHLYSWRPVRLKAWPVTDVVSHSLMLSGLLLLAGYFLYDPAPGPVWLIAAGATLFSVYGQLYNQLRDYDMDVAAGLKNTAIVLGESNTRRAMYLSIGAALACFVTAILMGLFPLWLGVVLLIGFGVAALLSPETDLRGSVAVDASGTLQLQGIVAVNITILTWLAQVILFQVLL